MMLVRRKYLVKGMILVVTFLLAAPPLHSSTIQKRAVFGLKSIHFCCWVLMMDVCLCVRNKKADSHVVWSDASSS